jgi:ElaB/YqjD/DUF883 family membrane-anchored ribosome-binding protein
MADKLKNKANETYNQARAKAQEAYSTGKERAEAALASSKTKATKAASATRESAKKAAVKTAEGVDHNPIAALVGGLAIGALAAALLPRTQREDKLVGNVGAKVRNTAKSAAQNAKQTALDQLDNLGVNADSAKDQFRDLVNKVGQAAQSAGSAAAQSVRKH